MAFILCSLNSLEWQNFSEFVYPTALFALSIRFPFEENDKENEGDTNFHQCLFSFCQFQEKDGHCVW